MIAGKIYHKGGDFGGGKDSKDKKKEGVGGLGWEMGELETDHAR